MITIQISDSSLTHYNHLMLTLNAFKHKIYFVLLQNIAQMKISKLLQYDKK